jgi:hypothetical protein
MKRSISPQCHWKGTILVSESVDDSRSSLKHCTISFNPASHDMIDLCHYGYHSWYHSPRCSRHDGKHPTSVESNLGNYYDYLRLLIQRAFDLHNFPFKLNRHRTWVSKRGLIFEEAFLRMSSAFGAGSFINNRHRIGCGFRHPDSGAQCGHD